MDGEFFIREFVRLARLNAKKARNERASLRAFYEGRSSAYLTAARCLRGKTGSKVMARRVLALFGEADPC